MKFSAIVFLSALATAAYIPVPEGMDQWPRCRQVGQRCNPSAGAHCCPRLYCAARPGRWGYCRYRWSEGEQGREQELEEEQEE